jgi:hypothetical protein
MARELSSLRIRFEGVGESGGFLGNAGATSAPKQTTACRRGCRIKPSEKMRGALAEVHVRAAVRDDLATDRALATDEIADFGTHP